MTKLFLAAGVAALAIAAPAAGKPEGQGRDRELRRPNTAARPAPRRPNSRVAVRLALPAANSTSSVSSPQRIMAVGQAPRRSRTS